MTMPSSRQPSKQGKNHATGLFKRAQKRQNSNSQNVLHLHFSPSRRDQANWGWIFEGGVILATEMPGGVAGQRSY